MYLLIGLAILFFLLWVMAMYAEYHEKKEDAKEKSTQPFADELNA